MHRAATREVLQDLAERARRLPSLPCRQGAPDFAAECEAIALGIEAAAERLPGPRLVPPSGRALETEIIHMRSARGRGPMRTILVQRVRGHFGVA